jgi:opacity protein-like surface antigen
MKRVSMWISIAILTAMCWVPAARAGMGGADGMDSGRIVSFGVGGGVSVPVGDAKDAFKNGFNGQGFARLNLKALPISPRIDFTFTQFDLASAKLAVPGASGTGQILAGVANLQFSLMNSGPVRPYLVAGVGAYSLKNDITGVPGTTSTTDTRLGVNGGAGVLFKLGLISAYVEGRVDNVFTEKGPITADQVQVVPVTFGIVF